jgi:hypothetical protein
MTKAGVWHDGCSAAGGDARPSAHASARAAPLSCCVMVCVAAASSGGAAAFVLLSRVCCYRVL